MAGRRKEVGEEEVEEGKDRKEARERWRKSEEAEAEGEWREGVSGHRTWH